MKKYLIGIDGGASRSTGILTDLNGQPIATGQGPSLNPLSIGWETFRAHLRSLFDGLLKDVAQSDIKAVCAGLAGVGSEKIRRQAEEEIAKASGSVEVHVISDAQAALWGAFGGEAGLLLIAGTGSICLGRDESGNEARCGGFGRLLGDEGSGYWIATEALRAALRQVDGRENVGLLPELICREYDLDDLREIIPLITGGDLGTERIAAFAAKVIVASSKDPAAREILRRAGRHLADLVIATSGKLKLDHPRVALWGGLWESPGEDLQQVLMEALDKSAFKYEIVKPTETPEWGAIRYLQSVMA